MTWTKFKNKTINILSTLLGIIMIAAIFYIRLVPRQARDLWQNMSQYRVVVTLFIVLVISISVFIQLKALGMFQNKQRKFLLYFTDKITKFVGFFKICLEQAYHFFILLIFYFCNYFELRFSYIAMLRPVIRSFCNQKNYNKYFVILVGLRIVPLIIFLCVFGFEVVYYRHLEITFKFIPILLVPLIEKVFIFILVDFYDLFARYFMFCRSATVKHKESIYYEGRYYSFSEQYNRLSEKFINFNDYFCNYFLVLKEIKRQTDKYKIQSEHVYIKVFFLLLTLLRLAILYYMYWLMITYKMKQGFPI